MSESKLFTPRQAAAVWNAVMQNRLKRFAEEEQVEIAELTDRNPDAKQWDDGGEIVSRVLAVAHDVELEGTALEARKAGLILILKTYET